MLIDNTFKELEIVIRSLTSIRNSSSNGFKTECILEDSKYISLLDLLICIYSIKYLLCPLFTMYRYNIYSC